MSHVLLFPGFTPNGVSPRDQATPSFGGILIATRRSWWPAQALQHLAVLVVYAVVAFWVALALTRKRFRT